MSHPTPPVFDGAEDRNGTRNFDEIGFWADYVWPGARSSYIYDDEGTTGGLGAGERFVIAGDQNSDPLDGDSIPGAIQQLLDHPRINDRDTPSSEGAVEATARRAEPTSRTGAIRSSTPPTSPTQHRATCVPTTCCPRSTCAPWAAASSGHYRANPARS